MPSRVLLASLLPLFACATARPEAPRAAPARPPASAAPRPAAPAPPPPPTFVEVKAGSTGFCARTPEGALWCWGFVELPGERTFVERSRPVPVDGLPPLAGFTLAGRSIVGWDAGGSAWVVAPDPYSPTGEIVVRNALPIQPARAAPPGGRYAPEWTPAKIASASGDCVVTAEGDLLCAHELKADFDRLPFKVRSAGSGPCAIDADGHAIAFHNFPWTVLRVGAGNLPVPALTPVRFEELGQVSSVACRYSGKDFLRVEGCGLGADGALRCSSAPLQQAIDGLREGRAATSVTTLHRYHLCVARDDGQARCEANDELMRDLTGALVGLHAGRGLALLPSGVLCAAGGDGLVRCWGEVGVPALGDGSQAALPAPVRLPAFDGADLIAHEGGITCVRMAPAELRCFGRIMTARVEPAAVPLPEPIDRLVGAFPACVRGAKSQSWYCRDPYTSFFAGSLPGGWEALRDARGKLLGDTVRSVAVNSGTGVFASLASGEQLAFFFRGFRQKLALSPARLFDKPVARLTSTASALLADGSGLAQRSDGPMALAGPLDALEPPCALAGAEVRCWSQRDRTRPLQKVADGVVQLSQQGSALTHHGEVLIAVDETEPVLGLKHVQGLPPMEAIAGRCGLSKDHQVWCWGTHSETDLPRARLSPAPVTPAPSAR